MPLDCDLTALPNVGCFFSGTDQCLFDPLGTGGCHAPAQGAALAKRIDEMEGASGLLISADEVKLVRGLLKKQQAEPKPKADPKSE